jgi:hypothetical protein
VVGGQRHALSLSLPVKRVFTHLPGGWWASRPVWRVKVKLSRYRPGGVLEVPEFLDNRHMKVARFSALRTGRLYPQKGFLILISVRC